MILTVQKIRQIIVFNLMTLLFKVKIMITMNKRNYKIMINK